VSVVKKAEFSNPESPHSDARDVECFFCGKPIGKLAKSIGAVCWAGHQDDWLYFHPQCAQRLGMHLIKDGLIAESGIRGFTP
jgi:hypothetical protein